MGYHHDYAKPEEMAARKQKLLDVLTEYARLEMVCPSMARLGREIGTTGDSVGAMLQTLRAEKKITWQIVWCGTGVGKVRLVTITATGHSTVKPAPEIRKQPRKEALSISVELERAKTTLRRCGRVVFNADITDGPSAKGFVKVDNLRLVPADVIALARRVTQ